MYIGCQINVKKVQANIAIRGILHVCYLKHLTFAIRDVHIGYHECESVGVCMDHVDCRIPRICHPWTPQNRKTHIIFRIQILNVTEVWFGMQDLGVCVAWGCFGMFVLVMSAKIRARYFCCMDQMVGVRTFCFSQLNISNKVFKTLYTHRPK